MRPDNSAFEQEYRARKSAGAAGLYDSYDSDIAHLSRILQRDDAPKTGRALEIGCGAGNIALWLAAQGFSVSGIDSAPSAISWARERAAAAGVQADFKIGNAVHLREFFTQPFDLIIDGACYHFVLGDDRSLFLQNVAALLQPWGCFVVESICSVSDSMVDTALEAYAIDGQQTVRHIGTINSLVEEVRAAGLYVAYLDVAFYRDEPTRGDLSILAIKLPAGHSKV